MFIDGEDYIETNATRLAKIYREHSNRVFIVKEDNMAENCETTRVEDSKYPEIKKMSERMINALFDVSGERYIGTKVINAIPMLLDTAAYILGEPCAKEKAEDDVYLVKYEDGYLSYSPRLTFEKAYRKTNALPFGLALEAIKKGYKCSRKGWNGKGQYIQLATDIYYTTGESDVVRAKHQDMGSKAILFVGTSGHQVGWLASQADMLSEDWYIVEGDNSAKKI